MKKYVTDINNGKYLEKSELFLNKYANIETNAIEVFNDSIITTYLGMGGAITEASGYNYSKLSTDYQQQFLKDYYSSNGLNYNWGRVSIGSNDFSLSSYDYSERKDLLDFSIDNDKEYVLPLLKDILKIKKLKIIASPWSPPKMFKSNKKLIHGGRLLNKFYSCYSDYLIKWINSYKREDINIDYVTIQNEPFAKQKWESCIFSLDDQKNFIYNHLISKLDNVKVLLWDHNKEDLYNCFEYLYENNNGIAGLGFHYYAGNYFENLKKIRDKYTDVLMINTESCCGYSEYNEKEWIKDAEIYMTDILGDFNSGANAYLDWNIFLDVNGGPSHIKNPVKSPIIFDFDRYIKTPIYYYLYHVSHFVEENYKIIKTSSFDDLIVTAFKNDRKIVIVVFNKQNNSFNFNLIINNDYINDNIAPHSIITYIYEK